MIPPWFMFPSDPVPSKHDGIIPHDPYHGKGKARNTVSQRKARAQKDAAHSDRRRQIEKRTRKAQRRRK